MSWRGAAYGVTTAIALASCTLLSNSVLDDKPASPAPSGSGGAGEGGAGGVRVACVDHQDCPGIDSTCRFRLCEGGFCGFQTAPARTGCSEDDGILCDGNGACVQCVSADDCSGDDQCVQGICAPIHCTDMVSNEGETGVDCGGTCPPCGNGQGCVDAGDCLSSFCDAGTCSACSNNGDCAMTAGTYCDGGECVPQKVNGDQCFADAECVSGACALEDQTCCDRACSGCESCLAQYTSLSNGLCGAVADGDDPHVTCDDAGATSCGNDGVCDGSGDCRMYASGTSCSTAMCSNGVASFDGSCDGGGSCSAPAPKTCAPFACGATTCRSSCTQASHCSSGNICAGNNCIACGDPVPPAGSCPNAACTGGCNGSTCTINCTGGASGPCSTGVTCPPGLDCIVNCKDAQVCRFSNIQCPPGRSCQVNCGPAGGNEFCRGATITCGDGPCSLSCSGSDACTQTVFNCGVNRCAPTCNGQTVTVNNSSSSCNYLPSGC